jgi:large subunit ribosomal protein L4
VKEVARYSAFADKLNSGSLIVVEDFTMAQPSTKEFKAILSKLNISGKSLLLTAEHNANVYLSSRNLQKAQVHTVQNANTYDIVNADVLVISEKSVGHLKAAYENQ